MGLPEIFQHPGAVVFGLLIPTAVFVWRKVRKFIFLEYGPETLSTGETRFRVAIYFTIPKRSPKPLGEGVGE